MRKTVFLFLFLLCFCILQATDGWKGMWINSENTQSRINTWQGYRKVTDISTIPPSLKARIAVDSKYWLWVNDRLVVFEGGLKRGPSRDATYYDVVELAPFLKAGKNTIAVLVWHFGQNGFSHLNSGTGALLFDAEAPGVNLSSDAGWQCFVYDAYQNTEAPFPNYRLPESNIRFDAGKEKIGWNRTDYVGNFPAAQVIAAPGQAPFGKLVERPIPLWKDYGYSDYVEVRKSAAGDTLYCKLPYNCHITPYFKVKAAAGKTIGIWTDNYMGGGTPNIRAEYITREGVQEYESLGWMNGHEVRYILPEGVEVLDLKYRETGYDTEFSGSFQCNDPFYNELWKRSARTLYVTMRDTYMDCPDRERAQWWGDEVNELGEAFYALSPSSHKLALKGIHELMDWQRPDGTLFAPIPAGNWARELPLQILASVGWYGFYTQYYYSADSSFIPVIYDRLHRYLHEVWKLNEQGQPVQRNGEWSWGDWGENIDQGVLTSAWYYLALKAEHAFALQLGKTADADALIRQMQRMKETFDSSFWTGTAFRTPSYKGADDDRSQAMAILSGLASPDKYPALLKVLKKEYHASPYMEKYVLEALFQIGETDFALKRMKERYGQMLSHTEYTTLFEGWGIGEEGFGGGTINHAWSGGPLTLLSQKVCGVEPTSPGFRTFRVAPQMGSLTKVSARINSANGIIETEITKKGKKLTIRLVVPEGTSAEVVFPNGKVKRVEAGEHFLM